jgi:hypothetical protein
MSDIDGLRRKMINAGIPSEYAATATGIAAEYAQAAYQCGYNRVQCIDEGSFKLWHV